MNTAIVEPFAVKLVPNNRRSTFLPRHVRGGMMKMIVFENTVYGVMGRICETYKGGSWDFFEVSNGAFFMAPQRETPVQIAVEGNFYGELTPVAAGIVATLMALSEVAFRYPDDDALSQSFHDLRDYVLARDDRAQILAAID